MFEVKNLEVVHYIQHDGDFYRRKYIKYNNKVLWQKRYGEADRTFWHEVTENDSEILENKFQSEISLDQSEVKYAPN